MPDDNEIWDEFKWEEFMKQQDKKVDRYMELFYRHQDDPNRDEIIAREMGWTWLLDEDHAEDPPPVSNEEEIEEGEGWKAAAGLESDEPFEYYQFKNLPVYRLSHEFALRAFRFVDQLPESARGDSAVVDFVSNAMIAGAKIAGGTGIGDDRDELGGNIAYCKRGLAASNLTIAALHEMNEKHIVDDKDYAGLIKEATEVRNAIALHVVDLREKFRRGV
jgi:hypothetical protein